LPELLALSLALGQAALVARITDLEVHVAAPDNRANNLTSHNPDKKNIGMELRIRRQIGTGTIELYF